MTMWMYACVLIIFIILIRKIFEISKFRKTVSKLPGFKTRNLLMGHMSLLIERAKKVGFHIALLEFFAGMATIYRKEGIYNFWASGDSLVFTYSAETVQPILTSTVQINKGPAYDFLHCWLGLGLLTSTGNKWRSRRKMITPTFHYRILDEFIPTFDKNSKLFIRNMKKLKDKDWVDIIPLVSLCTLDIISETAMGVEIKCQDQNKSDYINALQWFSDIITKRSMSPWLASDFIFNQTSGGKKLKETLSVLHGLTSKISKQRKDELKKENLSSENLEDIHERKKKEPLLDTLIKHQFNNNKFTDKDIREEVDTFMFEGHDTTSMGISWTLYYLGLYPEIQQKVYEEMQSIFGDDKDRPVTAEDIRAMKYLECVLKETERISPSVPLIERKCVEDIEIKGYTIPRGSILQIFIYALHRDPKVFPNPEVFDPDRFLPENSVGRHPFAYIPFSAGLRNCIGQKYAMIEMKVIVSRVILNFVIESIDPLDKIHSSMLLILRPVEGFRLKLRSRE